MSTRRTSTMRAAVSMLAAAALLAACDSDDSHGGVSRETTTVTAPSSASSSTGSSGSTVDASSGQSADATPPASVAPPSTTPPEAVIEISTPPGSSDAEGALEDVDGLECAAGDGRWSAAGSVVNPTDETVDYRIYVSFLDTAGETLALIETDVDGVDPRDTAEWSADFDSSAVGLRCVLRVERFTT